MTTTTEVFQLPLRRSLRTIAVTMRARTRSSDLNAAHGLFDHHPSPCPASTESRSMTSVIEIDQNDNLTGPPAREDGGLWPFALLVGEDTVYADSLSELIAYVIPGYDQFAGDPAGDVLAFLARVDMLSSTVAEAQALILATAVRDGEVVIETLSEDYLTALLSPRGVGVVDGSGFDNSWSIEPPLLLLDIDFAPFTDVPRITGNAHYYDPSDERAFLESLEKLGLVNLFVNASI